MMESPAAQRWSCEAVGSEVSPQRVSAVIPAQNEAATIGQVVSGLLRDQPDLAEIVVVDDGSSDGTAGVAAEAGAKVVRHPVARGYGAAVKSGILSSKGDFILTLDGDGQHRTTEVAKLLALAEECDLVAGNRVRLFHSSAWRLPGKWLLRQLSSYLVRQRIPDLNCGFRLFRRDVILPYLRLCSDAYSFSATSTVLLIYSGHRVAFVPVDVLPTRGRGRVTVRTGLDTLMLLLRIATLLDPLRIFLPISAGVFLAGIAWGTPYALAGRGVSLGALLLILTALLLFAVGLLSDQIAQLRKERLEK
jgi:glycosyltransferase involved in cell wall biosynthesis